MTTHTNHTAKTYDRCHLSIVCCYTAVIYLGIEKPLGLSFLRRELLLSPDAQLLPLQPADEGELVHVTLRNGLRLALRPLQPFHLGLIPKAEKVGGDGGGGGGAWEHDNRRKKQRKSL